MAIVGVIVLVAQAAAAEAVSPDSVETAGRTRRECLEVWATSREQPRRRALPSFSATRVLDIDFETVLRRRLDGPHTLELKLYTPRGHLYQVLTVPFALAAEEAAPSGLRVVDGYPQPLREQIATPVALKGQRRYTVSGSLPVAGTTIMINSLYGHWRVEPHLDGSPVACGPARVFEITQ